MYDNSKDNFESWMTDHTGVIRMATATEGTDQVYFYRASEKEPFTEYMRTELQGQLEPLDVHLRQQEPDREPQPGRPRQDRDRGVGHRQRRRRPR